MNYPPPPLHGPILLEIYGLIDLGLSGFIHAIQPMCNEIQQLRARVQVKRFNRLQEELQHIRHNAEILNDIGQWHEK